MNTSIQVGGAIVLAVSPRSSATGRPPRHGQLLPGMGHAIAVDVGIAGFGLLATGAVLLRARRTARRAAPSHAAQLAGEADELVLSDGA